MKGTPAVSLALLSFSGFLACNAILGNESDYRLVIGGAGEAGQPSSGIGGAAGRSNTGGGGAATSGGRAEGGDDGAPSAGSAGDLGGAPATGGAPASGGLSAGGSAGNVSPSGGSGAEGGSTDGGAGGAAECVPAGAEDCFNGLDDDCNDEVDCEDPACGAGAICVPRPQGGKLGDFAAMGGCAPGIAGLELYQGLSAAADCQGCSCVFDSAGCDAGIYGFGAKTCPGFDFATQLYNVFDTSCQPLPGDPRVHYYSIRGLAMCTPQGSPTLAPATWSAQAAFCPAERVGGGCGESAACVPPEAAPRCVLLEGENQACPPGYTEDTNGAWYEGFDDQRECTPCQCGFGIGACTGARIEVYSGAACTGTAATLSNGEEGNNCGLAFAPMSARIIGSPDVNSCDAQTFPTGELTELGPHTVCCR